MRAHHERNLWFGEPDFSRRFHRTCSFASFSGTSLIQGLALLPRLAFPAGLVPVCQTFVRRCQSLCGIGCSHHAASATGSACPAVFAKNCPAANCDGSATMDTTLAE